MIFDRSITASWLVTSLASLLLGLPIPVSAQAPADREAGYPATGPISGYMDFHFNKDQGRDGVLDLHRFVLILSHSFSSRIHFVGELEVEHAFVEGLEESGEVVVEQAYVDFLITRGFNLRAGMMLVPMGIINERHEPPIFNGVERPFVDTVILPSTWFEAGAGVHGQVGRHLRYRAYVMAPLDALKFTADGGISEGRQKRPQSNIRNPAFAGRAEYIGVSGLTLGASAWIGRSSFAAPHLDTKVGIAEADVRYKRDRVELRGEMAQVSIGDAARLNDTVQQLTGVSPNVARALRGSYGEAAYRIWAAGAPRDLVAFVRYENFDSQFRMPSGFVPLMHLFSLPSHACQPIVPDDVNVVAHRAPIPLFGAGLVEAIPDEALTALEDPVDRDRDGVSGVAAIVVDVATGERRVGRFGWKAQHATLLAFGADAYRNEMGITNDLFPLEFVFGVGSEQMRRCDLVPEPEDVRDPLTRRRGIDNFEAFMRFMAPVSRAPIDEVVRDGERIFLGIGCASCHVPVLTTGSSANPLFHRKPVPLFSDLLLHEIGTGDGIKQAAASPEEIRTPALWGLRLRRPLLHDGSAATIEDAIASHRREAELARRGFLQLSPDDRRRLLAFLRSL